ncbi:MAG: Lrp/AsnC family transcriptional regulator [Euryarchaeota archaeon]|nr:Lrp/AsnC family transcriptional regulator [Euryarchaeota archaeon]
MPTTDELDERLVALLRDDARASFVELAKELGTSEGTVRSRLKRLVDTGVIRQFTIRTAGKAVKALVSVAIETNVNTSAISQKIAKWAGVMDVWEVSGDEDILVRVDVASTEDLNEIIERIRGFPEVRHTHSRLILREL